MNGETSGLDALADRVRRDLEILSYPARAWLEPRTTAEGAAIHDVIIVGGGQSGLAVAFGLMRERISNVLVLDQNAEDHAGPWRTFARMPTLRTPKYLTGPDLGIPNLTPRAWYEAQHGEGSWEAMGLLPKEAWAAYLRWYRVTLGIPVRSEICVGALRWCAHDRAWEVPSRGPGGDELRYARRVVLATGIEGSGQWQVPAIVSDALPADRYAHTRSPIDFPSLRGKRVAVLGCGASAFDNASTALEHGAREVRLFFRRQQLVNVNPYRWAEFVGFLKHLGDLADADRWRFISQILRMGQLPPKETYDRAVRHAAFHLHPGSSWRRVELAGDVITITTERGTVEADFVIVGTGFVTDLALRPELALIEQHIARWADRYTPPEGDRQEDLMRHPYLGPGFEFIARDAAAAPYLGYLYNYTFGCLPSLGFGGASISGMKYSIPRVVGGITGSFFSEDRQAHYDSLCHYDRAEF